MTLINSWTKTTTTLAATSSIFVLGTGNDNFVLTTGTTGDYPYYSRDGGTTWTAATVNDSAWTTVTSVCQIAVSPSDGRIYLSNQSLAKLYVSTDNGVSYSIASTGLAFTCLACLGSTLFANIGSGTVLYKSTDHGATFTQITIPDTTATGISCYATTSAVFVCARHLDTNMAYMYRSLDAGSTWTQVLTDHTIGFIGAIFSTQNNIYLGIYDVSGGILLLKSSDNFSTSTALATPLLPAPTTSGGSDSSNDIYFGSMYIPGVICTSNDAGTTIINEAPDVNNTTVTLATSDTSIVAVTTGANGISIYRSALPGGKVTPPVPEISPATTLNASPLTVTITDRAAGAAIYYTLDGSTPTALSTLYTAPFTLTYATATELTLKAIAIVDSVSSAVASQFYRIGSQVSTPAISSVEDTYANNITVTITDTASGASIYYTVDGTAPTTASILYTAPFLAFEATNNIKAIAVKSGMFDSEVASASYAITRNQSDYPTLGPYLKYYGTGTSTIDGLNPIAAATRKFTTGTTVHVDMVSSTSLAFDHAPIYYTLDGTTPTLSSTKYTGPVEITSSCVIKAAAIKGVQTPLVGNVTTITYVFTAGTLTKPALYTLAGEHVDIASGTVTTPDANNYQYPYYSNASVFIPDYDNGVGALAISLYSIGNSTHGYIYLCDPITCEVFERFVALPADIPNGIKAIAYAADSGMLYAADNSTKLYSVDTATRAITELSTALPGTVHNQLVYNNTDRCLYGVCNGSNNNAFVKYNIVTNVLSTLNSNVGGFCLDFCDHATGILYGHYSTTPETPGLFSIASDTGATTKVITTTNHYDKVVREPVNGNTYAITYSAGVTDPLYILDIENATETLAFNLAFGRSVGDLVAASLAIVPPPVFSVAAGMYTVEQTVSITDRETSATIYYTTDGSTPTTASSLYSSPLSISDSVTLKAVAVKSGYAASSVTEAVYTIDYTKVPKPLFSLASGNFNNDQQVTISSTKAGVSFYYTIDGSTPTASSTHYTNPITISGNTVLKAIGTFTGLTNSDITSATYNFTCVDPIASIAAGTWGATRIITLASNTANTTIYYTLDGTAPTQSSSIYTEPLQLYKTTTLSFIATRNNYASSAVVTNAYTIIRGPIYYAEYNVYVVNPTTKQIAKINSLYDGSIGVLTADTTSLYMLGSHGLTTINPHTGEYTTKDITFPISGGGEFFQAADYYKGSIYTVISSGGSDAGIYKIDIATASLTLIRTSSFSDPPVGLTVYNDKIYFGIPYKSISYMNLDGTGETVMNSDTHYVWGCLYVFNDQLYAGTYSYTDSTLTARPGGLYRINMTNGEVAATITTVADSYWCGLTSGAGHLYARSSAIVYEINTDTNTITPIVSEYQ